jgi:hypothetical protein
MFACVRRTPVIHDAFFARANFIAHVTGLFRKGYYTSYTMPFLQGRILLHTLQAFFARVISHVTLCLFRKGLLHYAFFARVVLRHFCLNQMI